ncbi:hypothetical protein GQX74_005965 [Glossina fuscipes]|nr:hypothetical protein GQX74_005965 [Glossina fuscipes]
MHCRQLDIKECEDDDKDDLHNFIPPTNYIKISQGKIQLVHQSALSAATAAATTITTTTNTTTLQPTQPSPPSLPTLQNVADSNKDKILWGKKAYFWAFDAFRFYNYFGK